MIYDKDRGISAIRYNLLNLPDTIQFTNGNQIVHRYDAVGNRLATNYYTRKVTTTVPLGNTLTGTNNTTNYNITRDAFHNNIVYTANNNDAYGIEFVHNPEGYIRYYSSSEHYHFYYIKDLLGNIRETYVHPEAGYKECIQRMQYYPSGLPWVETTNSSEQPWKYNSKEFVEMHGLDEYDSEARWYYPAICRTTTMDPLAEKYYSTSPYAWCGNNPVRFVDPLGMSYNINSDGSVEQVNDSVDNKVVLNADNEREKVEITLEEGDIVGVEETDEANILELENKKAAEELYIAMGIYMNTLEFNNVISEKDGVLHYYVGNSGAMHETKVGGYIFLTLYETINFMSHFHPLSPKASEKDKENAIKYYRNKQDYPHANPDAVLEVMYLGSDGELKTTNY